MTSRRFSGTFTQQEPICEEAIQAAVAVLNHGRLHRYNTLPDEPGETALLEAEYATFQKVPYCLAVASGGQAMTIALRAAGVENGDAVLTNAFTLAPVPGAIAAVGGNPIFVETDENLRIDLNDLALKAERTQARFLLLSHMRGHICDMEEIQKICRDHDLIMIEDCAHTMGASWKGKPSGNFGLAGCFSTQTYKHMNSGEGGLLTSADPEFMARAIILSGSYMLYERHGAAPPAEIFQKIRLETPNISARMDNLRAAILRPQLTNLSRNIGRWNERYEAVAQQLKACQAIKLPQRPQEENMVASSIQFRIPSLDYQRCLNLIEAAASRGVELKWFGAKEPTGFTSSHHSWQYVQSQNMPQTDEVLATLFDIRLPLTFSIDDCDLIGSLIVEAALDVLSEAAS